MSEGWELVLRAAGSLAMAVLAILVGVAAVRFWRAGPQAVREARHRQDRQRRLVDAMRSHRRRRIMERIRQFRKG